MGRKKRHKLGFALVLGLLAISMVIYKLGEFMMPVVSPSSTRRALLTRRLMDPPDDNSLVIDHLQKLTPSISPLPGKVPHEAPGTMESAPTVQGAAPSVQGTTPMQPISSAVHSPAPSITIAPPPFVVQPPNVPNVAVPSFPSNNPIPTSSPVSSPPYVNSPPLVAPSPMIPQHVMPPVQSSEPKAVSPTSLPSPPSGENHMNPYSIASPPPEERSTHISKQNYSHVAPSPLVSQHVQGSQPKVAQPPKLPAHLSPHNNLPSSTKGTSTPNPAVAPSPLETPTHLSHSSNSSSDRENASSPAISPIQHREGGGPVSAPPTIPSRHISYRNNSHEADGPSISPAVSEGRNATHTLHRAQNPHAVSPTESALPLSASSPAPAVPFHKRKGEASSSLAPVPAVPSTNRQHKHHAPPISTPAPVPAVPSTNRQHKHHASPISTPAPVPAVPSTNQQHKHHAPPLSTPVSPSSVHSANGEEEAPSPSPISSQRFPYTHHKHKGASHAPSIAPITLPQTTRALPPPPPNQNCIPITCTDPYTNTPPGSPCLCVIPIKVGICLSVSLYKFFNLVSQLAQEIASGVKMKQSQVRVMGANAATEDPDKTVVLVDLVPLGEKFDNITALLVFDKFWHKEVDINPSNFGDYVVLYVTYPGLPPSPPPAPDMATGNKGNPQIPLAADISKQRAKQKAGIIAIIVLSSVFALILFAAVAWFVIFKLRYKSRPPGHTLSSLTKASGTGVPFLTSQPSSITASFNSNMVTCKGTAKTFTLLEMERATNGFDESRLIGEGGFGRVYEGILGDGKHVAVKVLKHDDQQGSREFMAEVEMLSCLHHRNLVRLIGICTEEHFRCLVYELVPNGSVESHLHGADKETGPLDWDARVKIALGAGRALAYLHEDSSPHVIHRDFKSSNILLEHDFTPKVSDFGLARAALGEDNDHISTRVMGTFGYVAPEYAMTGHLLVKSDVYSYGVVLLELLTGRKPVDMFRPAGQENLVTWARPLLTYQEGLESIADPALGTVPFDTLAKVAAIASMCVQPEVDQRPFMGEVVQALKLVSNDGNGYSKAASETDTSDNATSTSIELGVFGAASSSPRYEREGSGSFRVYVGSGPLKKGHEVRVWERGSSSEHGVASRFGMDLEGSEKYL